MNDPKFIEVRSDRVRPNWQGNEPRTEEYVRLINLAHVSRIDLIDDGARLYAANGEHLGTTSEVVRLLKFIGPVPPSSGAEGGR